MSEIIAINEIAFMRRYGISLSKLWDKQTTDVKETYLDEARAIEQASVPQGYVLNNDEILRAFIGFRNKKQLDFALDGATHVTSILVWEPDAPAFLAACALYDLSRYIADERIRIELSDDEKSLRYALEKTVNSSNILHRHFYAFGKYLREDNAFTALFIKLFEEVFINVMRDIRFAEKYEHLPYENLLYAVNILNDNSTINQLMDSITVRDIPVIIVAAGPSLMKNVCELKNAKGKAIIVAVAHAMKTLARNNIQPDLVAVMDPASSDFLDFDMEKDYHLLCCVSCNRKYQEKYNGKIVYYGFPMYAEFFSSDRTDKEIRAELDTGSVATDVLSVFTACGFKNFILIGQDLAYDEDGMSHTEKEMENRVEELEKIIETEGINGGKVRTRDDWELFRMYYEKRILQDPNLNVIDATEGGALIHGSKVMKLKDAIEQYCIKDHPVSEWFMNIRKGDEREKKIIDEWFLNLSDMNERTASNLNRATSLNEEISNIWDDNTKWDEEFSSKCKRYDIIYHILLEGDDGAPLREYCRGDLKRYLDDMLVFEGDDNIRARMSRERELFELMNKRLCLLEEYINMIR